MKLKNEILTELQGIAPQLALLEKTNPYKVPDGYFLNFKNILLEKLKFQNAEAELKSVAPELAKLEINLTDEIPAAYFSNFSMRVIDKIRAQEILNELKEMAPGLSKLQKINVFEVPAGYFDMLAGRILDKTLRQQQSPVPAVQGWLQRINEMLERAMGGLFKPKYTFAFAGAVTTFILAVMFFMKVDSCNDLDCKFAQLSTEEINAYLDGKSDAYSDEIFEMNLDDKALPAAVPDSTLYKDAFKDVDDAALNTAISD